MKDNFNNEMVTVGKISFGGFLIGLGIFAFICIKKGIFFAIVNVLKDWDMLALVNLLGKYEQPLIIVMIVWFGIFLLSLIVAYIINKKVFKNKEIKPWPFILYFTMLLGFIFIPFVIFIVGLVFGVIYLVWSIVEFINLFLFGYIAYFCFSIIDFIFNKILGQEVILTKFNQEDQFLFFQITIFFTMLPYTFRLIAIGFEKMLSKVSGELGEVLLKPIYVLSVNFFRYMTYTFAFFTYLMSFLWELSGNIIAIKEGLLAFIIIDVVVFGLYNYISEKKKKSLVLICNELSRELELIQHEIVSYDLFSYENCRSRIKNTSAMEELNEKIKKHSDKKLALIYERVIGISPRIVKGLSFKDLYIEIKRIQRLIDEYVVK